MAITSGIKVSAHVPAVASNKQNAVIRLGMRRDMVAALWDGVTLIPDEITLAKKGQIQITAVLLARDQGFAEADWFPQAAGASFVMRKPEYRGRFSFAPRRGVLEGRLIPYDTPARIGGVLH